MKGESVVLTMLSRLRFVFPLMVLLSSSICFLISRRRFEFGPFRVASLRRSLLVLFGEFFHTSYKCLDL